MYMTVLTGHVAREDWFHLKHSFDHFCGKPPRGLLEIDLVQGMENQDEWEVVSLWASQEAFEEATRQQLTAACEQMFSEAGSIPQRAQFKLVTRYQKV
jgi:heme-degrading monooxygenase HmoA